MNAPVRSVEIEQIMKFKIDATPDFEVVGGVADIALPVIAITGKVLGVIAAKLTDEIGARIADIRGDVWLDLRQCAFFSSVALGMIYILSEQRQELGGKLILVGANSQITKMIKMMGMDEYFAFAEDIAKRA